MSLDQSACWPVWPVGLLACWPVGHGGTEARRTAGQADFNTEIADIAETAEFRTPHSCAMRALHDSRVFSFVLLTTKNNTLSPRSEEHTSELQSLAYLVCRLLLEKKKI